MAIEAGQTIRIKPDGSVEQVEPPISNKANGWRSLYYETLGRATRAEVELQKIDVLLAGRGAPGESRLEKIRNLLQVKTLADYLIEKGR